VAAPQTLGTVGRLGQWGALPVSDGPRPTEPLAVELYGEVTCITVSASDWHAVEGIADGILRTQRRVWPRVPHPARPDPSRRPTGG